MSDQTFHVREVGDGEEWKPIRAEDYEEAVSRFMLDPDSDHNYDADGEVTEVDVKSDAGLIRRFRAECCRDVTFLAHGGEIVAP